MKTIAISNTINGVKSIVETEATTLGELKQFMNEHGISYPTDALWYSGLTKSRLEFDNSEFISDNPRTCNINGTETTVHGVVLIVPSKNKIESGCHMSRCEAYAFIRSNDLAEEVKEAFGKNYTNVPTEDLINFINEHDNFCDDEDMEDDNECCCNMEIPKTPIAVLKCIHDALGRLIDIVDERQNQLNARYNADDDLDKMVAELQG